MKLQERANFYQKLYTGVKAGLTLRQIVNARLLPESLSGKTALLARQIDKGVSMAQAFKSAGLVSAWETQLITIGESSGRLETVFGRLNDFFTAKVMQFGHLKSKLVTPMLTLLVAITVLPLPALFGGILSPGVYLVQVVASLGVLYLLYRTLLVVPFENATPGAFNPVLIRSLGFTGREHFLRLQFEVSYLGLLTLCLDSGLDAVQALKLLQENVRQKAIRKQHALAISKVSKGGASLTEALGGQGIIQNSQVLSFLAASEQSGTLHSDMREFIRRKQVEVDATADYWIRNISVLVYLGSVVYAALKIVPLFMGTLIR